MMLYAVLCLVTQLCPTLCDPRTVAHQAPLSLEILQAGVLEWVAFPFCRASSQPRDQTPWKAGSSLSEPPGKPGNSAVGSVSLLQGIFPTQESQQGLLRYRRILYQLSLQGSHNVVLVSAIQQRESAVKCPYVPSLLVVTERWAGLPVLRTSSH